MSTLINIEEALGRVRNNKKLFLKLLDKFMEQTDINELKRLIQAQDYPGAETLAHTIKGTSGNLSLNALYEQAQVLDSQLKRGTADPNTIAAFEDCFTKTLEAIKELKAQNG